MRPRGIAGPDVGRGPHGGAPAASLVAPGSVFAPLRGRVFRWLWIGLLVGSVGSWAQTVGAQWLFIDDPDAATIVSLVAAANALPMMLFALPAGALSDAFDRRYLLIGVQVYAITVSLLLAVLSWFGLVPPPLLLLFTFAIGLIGAVQLPAWQPLMTELVPREQFAAATRLDMVNVNGARALGPALAGVVIASLGVPAVFVMNAVCALALLVVLLAWRRPRMTFPARERFLPAVAAGARYVRHEPVVRLILTRLAVFVVPATALWALLPLIASRQFGLGSAGYGVMFGALGVGAILGALLLGRIRRRLSAHSLLTVASVAYGAAFGALAFVPDAVAGVPVLVVAGACWTAVAATLNAELQLFLPGWVRARAIAIYLMTFTGAQALASPLWGVLTQVTSLRLAIGVAAALVVGGGLAGLLLRIPDSSHLDRTPADFWDEAAVVLEPGRDAGPVRVSVSYQVPDEALAGWQEAMAAMRRSRQRSGASRWELYRVGEQPGIYVEHFTVPSWAEHQRQHAGRLTVEDRSIEEHAQSFITQPATTVHLLPVEPRPSMQQGEPHVQRP